MMIALKGKENNLGQIQEILENKLDDVGGREIDVIAEEKRLIAKETVGRLLDRLAVARADPSRPPCDRLQLRWAMPAASRLGAISPVSARGGSWSAVGPSGCEPGRVMSTG